MKKCQLCSYEFDETSLACHSSCPLSAHCAVICCPNCGYQTLDESKSAVASLAAALKERFGRLSAAEKRQ